MSTIIPIKCFNYKYLIALSLCFLLQACLKGTDPANKAGSSQDAQKPSGEAKEAGPPTSCEDTSLYFENHIAAIVAGRCANCHENSPMAFTWKKSDSDSPASLLSVVEKYYENAASGASKLIQKPLGEEPHGGGQQISSAEEILAWRNFVGMLNCKKDGKVPVNTDNDLPLPQLYAEELSPTELLQKTTMRLARRHPSQAEIDRVRAGAPVTDVIEPILFEEGYLRAVRLWFANQILSDGVLYGQDLASVPNADHFKDGKWFEDVGRYGPDKDKNRLCAWQGFVREPLELITYIVKQNRPFREILSADFTMVNYCSARSYGVEDAVRFTRGNDPSEFQPVKLWLHKGTENQTAYPHSGVLTTIGYNRRFEFTESNLHRSKANLTFKFLYGMDIGKLAALRPVGSDIAADETLNNPDCTSCHDILDPMARLFKNFSSNTTYTGFPDKLYELMKPAGLFFNKMPEGRSGDSLKWLAEQAALDPRFAVQIAKVFYAGIVGRNFFGNPSREPSEYESKFIEQIGNIFYQSDYDVHILVKEILNSPFYKAKNCISEDCMLANANFGTDSVLPPELLDEKLFMVTGMHWRNSPKSQRLLQSIAEASYFVDAYLNIGPVNSAVGGTDFVTNPQRKLDPNVLYVSAINRMALQMGCKIPAQDFARSSPKIFGGIDLLELNRIVAADGKLPAEIVESLVTRVYAAFSTYPFEPASQREIQSMMELFNYALETGRKEILSKQESVALTENCKAMADHESGEALSNPIADDPQFVLRALSAVVSLAIMDDRFLTE